MTTARHRPKSTRRNILYVHELTTKHGLSQRRIAQMLGVSQWLVWNARKRFKMKKQKEAGP